MGNIWKVRLRMKGSGGKQIQSLWGFGILTHKKEEMGIDKPNQMLSLGFLRLWVRASHSCFFCTQKRLILGHKFTKLFSV